VLMYLLGERNGRSMLAVAQQIDILISP